MSRVSVNFSELVNHNRATLALLDDNTSILLRRRDGEDLVLQTESHAAQDRATIATAARFFVAMMRHDRMSRELVLDVLPEALPWVRLLPDTDRGEFAMELVETALAADSIDNFTPVIVLIAQWRHTAEILADPELHAILTREYAADSDGGRVPPPTIPEGFAS